MRTRNLPHALGFVATLALPSMGCTESHPEPPDSGGSPDTSIVDAAMTPDVLLAMDTPASPADGGRTDAGSDAPVIEDAGDHPDGYYPDGIRG